MEIFKDNNIHIALASDSINIPAMATSVVSALHNKNKDSFYIFYLLIAGEVSNDLREKLKNCISGFEKNCQINLIDLGNKFNNINLGNYISYAAYFRLVLSSLLPNLEKIIYIDTDTIVKQDLNELWYFDIDENYIAGVPAIWGGKLGGEVLYKAGFKSTDFFINSGVLLMNLIEWRKNDIEQKCLAKIGDKELCKIERGDQIILNFICYPNIGFLPVKWNMNKDFIQNFNGYFRKGDTFYSAGEINEAWNNPAIFHWTGPNKPWLYYDVPLAHEWFRYYNKTPFGDKPLQRKSCIKSNFRKSIKNLIRIIRNV